MQMVHGMRQAVFGFAILTLCLSGQTARADAIDGRWCAEDGRRMDIQGPTVVTPHGSTLQGRYGRHDFAYAVPVGEPGAGQAITMRLNGDTTINLWRGETMGAPEIWKRCTPVG